MNDTSDYIKNLLKTRFTSLSGEARIMMGFDMFNSSREIVISSLPKNLSQIELRKQLFFRFYQNDFSKENLNKIIRWIEQN